jgi:hypothetical protein
MLFHVSQKKALAEATFSMKVSVLNHGALGINFIKKTKLHQWKVCLPSTSLLPLPLL